MSRKKPELLSPSGDLNCLYSAVSAGCDAVYFGGTHFNARQGGLSQTTDPKKEAVLFTEENIAKAVRFCTLHGVKTLLTVNTVVKEEEWEDFTEEFDRMAATGITGVIVQDMGVASYIHEHYPSIELHGSTQMSIHSAEGARFLERHGFTRVVLARELSLEEVRKIREAVSIELEVFIHGAMCYSVSGQCLLSSLIGGRSGNRGMCAQPCRLIYQPDGAASGCYMNLKDMCTLEHIPDLMRLGVDSFKIEGRLKSPEYVYGVTKGYRMAMDGMLDADSLEKELKTMKQLFNRGGFSSGYWVKGPRMIEQGSPKHQGLPVGTVKGFERGMVKIQSEEILHPLDVLEIRTQKQPYPSYQLQASNLTSEHTALIRIPVPVSAGMKVYRLRDQALMDELSHFTVPLIPVRIQARIHQGTPMSIIASSGHTTVSYAGDIPQIATGGGLSEDKVRKAIGKTGGTPFELAQLDLDLEEGLFAPVSALNDLRRSVLTRLEETLSAPPEHRKISVEAHPCEPAGRAVKNKQLQAVISTSEQWEALKERADIFTFFRSERFEEETLQRFIQEASERGIGWGLALPYYITRPCEGLIRKLNVQHVLIRNPGQLEELKELTIKRYLDFTIPVLNQTALSFWEKESDQLTFSPELTAKEMEMLEGEKAAFMAYGKIPVMISKQCMQKESLSCRHGKQASLTAVKDRMQEQWDLELNCPSCYTVLYSGKPVWMADRSRMLEKIPAKSMRLYFLDEDKEKTLFVVDQYQKLKNGQTHKDPDFPIQRGHFMKPVL